MIIFFILCFICSFEDKVTNSSIANVTRTIEIPINYTQPASILFKYEGRTQNTEFYKELSELCSKNSKMQLKFYESNIRPNLAIFFDNEIFKTYTRLPKIHDIEMILAIYASDRKPDVINSTEELMQIKKNTPFTIVSKSSNLSKLHNFSYYLTRKYGTVNIVECNNEKLYMNYTFLIAFNYSENIHSANDFTRIESFFEKSLKEMDFIEMRNYNKIFFAFLTTNISEEMYSALDNITLHLSAQSILLSETSINDFEQISGEIIRNGTALLFHGLSGSYKIINYENVKGLDSVIRGSLLLNFSRIIKQRCTEFYVWKNVISLSSQSFIDFIEMHEASIILYYSIETNFSVINEFMAASQDSKAVFGMINVDLNGCCGGFFTNSSSAPRVLAHFSISFASDMNKTITRESVVDFANDIVRSKEIVLKNATRIYNIHMFDKRCALCDSFYYRPISMHFTCQRKLHVYSLSRDHPRYGFFDMSMIDGSYDYGRFDMYETDSYMSDVLPDYAKKYIIYTHLDNREYLETILNRNPLHIYDIY